MTLVAVLVMVGATIAPPPVDVDAAERAAIVDHVVAAAARTALREPHAHNVRAARPPSRRLTEADMRALAARYFDPADVDLAIRVAWCESRWDVAAANPTSSARGLWQHLGRFWSDRSRRAGIPGASIYDPDVQARVAAWLVYHGGGWGHWYPSEHCWGG